MVGQMLLDLPLLNSVVNRGPKATALAALTLLSMMIATVGTIRTGHWTFRLVLLLAAAVWPLPDHPLQGPILVSLSYQHGVHLADLLSVLAVITAVLPFRRRPRAIPS
jgi:hypothetical protein